MHSENIAVEVQWDLARTTMGPLRTHPDIYKESHDVMSDLNCKRLKGNRIDHDG